MPGKNTQDWTDDAAFWDDAWTDMELRLDQKKERRGVAFWLRWAVPVLLLLAGVVGTRLMILSNRGTKAEPVVEFRTDGNPRLTAADQTIGEAKFETADLGPSFPEREETSGDTAAKPRSSNPSFAPAPAPKTSFSLQASPAASNSAAYVKPSKQLALPTPQAKDEKLPAPNIDLPTTPVQNIDPEISLQAVALLKVPPFDLTYDDELPSPPIIKHKSPIAFGLEAGGTYANSSSHPGLYAGFYAEIPAGKRIRFPISLRYRQDELRIASPSEATTVQDINLDPTGGANDFTALNLSVDDRPLNQLQIRGIELASGISGRLAGRLHGTFQLGGVYLFAARGLTDLRLEDGEYNASYISNSGQQDAVGFGGGTPAIAGGNLLLRTSSEGLGNSNGLNRWLIRSHLGLEYGLRPNITLQGGVNRVHTPIFTGDLLAAKRTQFSLGLRYQLR